MAASLSRQAINDELSSLDHLTGKLFDQYGHGKEFYDLATGLADALSKKVGPDDAIWAHTQVDAILAKHGIDLKDTAS